MSDFSQSVNHVATMLVVASIDVSANFYADMFGFEIVRREEHIALLKMKGMMLYLIKFSPPTADKPGVTLQNTNENGTTSVNIVFNVLDCTAAYEYLSARGLKFLTPPQSPPWGGMRCFAWDPDGYLIEIEEGT